MSVWGQVFSPIPQTKYYITTNLMQKHIYKSSSLSLRQILTKFTKMWNNNASITYFFGIIIIFHKMYMLTCIGVYIVILKWNNI